MFLAPNRPAISTKASSQEVVPEVRVLHDRSRVPQDASRPLHVHEEFLWQRLPDIVAISG